MTKNNMHSLINYFIVRNDSQVISEIVDSTIKILKAHLTSEDNSAINELIIDFLFRFKDRHPYSDPNNKENVDTFDTVINFLCDNGLKPSQKLQQEYHKLALKLLDNLPMYNRINDQTNMDKDLYSFLSLMYAYTSRDNIFFAPKTNLKTKIGTNDISVGYFTEEEDEKLIAGVYVNESGEVYEGYFKNGQKHYFGKLLIDAQDSAFEPCETFYEGCFSNGKFHGKGEYHGDIEKLVGEWVNGMKHGEFECYGAGKKKTTRKYNNDELIE